MTLQVMLGIAALAGMSLYPPAEGRILLMPLVDRDVSATARIALASDALLLGAGPMRGSLVVVGQRARLSRHLPTWGILMLAAPPAGCGSPADRAAA